MRPTAGEGEGVWVGVRVREAVFLGVRVCEAVELGVRVCVAEGESVPVALEDEVWLEEEEAVAEDVRVEVALRVPV